MAKARDITPQRNIPDLSKIQDQELARKISVAFEDLYSYIDFHLGDIRERTSTVESKATETSNLVEPFIGPDGVITNPALQSQGTLNQLPEGASNQILATPNGSSGVSSLRSLVADDLPVVPLAKLDTKVLKTEDGLSVTAGIFAIGGKVSIKDNNGNTVDVLTV